MKSMPLYKRFIGSTFDKVLLLAVFVVIFALITNSHVVVWDLGIYFSLGCHAPSEYSYITLESLHFIDYGYPLKYNHMSEYELIQRYKDMDIEKIVVDFDLAITSSFIILNILYYLISETFLGESVGKRFMDGKLIDNGIGNQISFEDAFKRGLIRGSFMFLAVGLRFLFDVNYFVVIVLFFLFVDIPVLIKRRSMIDILSKVFCVVRPPLLHMNTEKSIEKMEIEEKGKEKKTVEDVKQSYTTNQSVTTKTSRFKLPHFQFVNFKRIKSKYSVKKALFYFYLIWVAINISVLAYTTAYRNSYSRHETSSWRRGSYHNPTSKKYIYPIETSDIVAYDFSEFIIYTVALPLCIFSIVKLILLFVPPKSNEQVTKGNRFSNDDILNNKGRETE